MNVYTDGLKVKFRLFLVCVFNVNEQNYKCQWVPVLLPE